MPLGAVGDGRIERIFERIGARLFGRVYDSRVSGVIQQWKPWGLSRQFTALHVLVLCNE